MDNGMYGITQDTSQHEQDFKPAYDPESKPIFRAIFWSIVAGSIIGVAAGWMI